MRAASQSYLARRRGGSPGRQRGIALLLYAVGMIAVVGMTGFALDLGRAYLTKTRLQNALDAAALDAALVLSNTGSTSQATAAAQASYSQNITSGTPAISYSSTWPFGATGSSPKFVKVAVASLPITAGISAVFLGSNSFAVSGSAIAGPQGLAGDLCGVPIGVCGDAASGDQDCSDGNGCFGIDSGDLSLKDAATGPGNYGLVDMGSGAGAVADGFAGATEACTTPGKSYTTKPGTSTSTTSKALNSRFGAGGGSYSDTALYPPDLITTSPMTYAAYKAAMSSGAYTNPGGVARRRTILVPIIDCSTVKGSSSAKVLGAACMFLRQQTPTSGGQNGTVYAAVISDPCASPGGTPSTDPTPTASRIVLFQSGAQS